MIHVEGGGWVSAENSVAEKSLKRKWKWPQCSVFPSASYRVMFHPNEKGTLKHLPLSLIGESFPFGFQGEREGRADVVEWKLRAEDKPLLPRGSEKQRPRWCERPNTYSSKDLTLLLCWAGWICWNARSGTHNRGGAGANNAGFSSENKSKRQTDSSRKLQHHLAAHSARFPLNETPHFLATLLKKRPFKTHCHLCFQSSCRMSEVAAAFEGHLIIRVKRLQGHKQSLFRFRHLVEAHSSYFCPVNWDFWTTSPSLPLANMNSASGWIKAQTTIMLNMELRNLPSAQECVAHCPLLSTVDL